MYYPSYYYALDPTYLLLILAMLVSLGAQALVNSVTRRYAAVPARCGLTGAQLARQMLDSEGLSDVVIERVPGNLTDHYDPATRTLRLSQAVADAGSIT
ncbi:MAG: zinc metallopeptidase, partial [Clostridia bacterium]|nr:zinc metallopeptidase [Clostridia bacterium]